MSASRQFRLSIIQPRSDNCTEEDDDDERQSARDPSIALREEEEEASSEEPVITWPEDIFEYVFITAC